MRYRREPGKGTDGALDRFGSLLQSTMVTRGESDGSLGAKVGMSGGAIAHYRYGHHKPLLSTLQHLADLLLEPMLVQVILPLYRRVCPACKRGFIDGGSGHKPRTFCSDACAKRAAKRRRRGKTKVSWALVRHERDELRMAVAAMCRTCEPSGLCRLAECKLRSVSPFPLAQPVVAVA